MTGNFIPTSEGKANPKRIGDDGEVYLRMNFADNRGQDDFDSNQEGSCVWKLEGERRTDDDSNLI